MVGRTSDRAGRNLLCDVQAGERAEELKRKELNY
jgi:hypothetical protein